MTSPKDSALPSNLADSISEVPILIVGAGGIGCELLKNIVLTGFKNITIIDLDTIDTSNLNRQFLFQKRHVGQSKSKVARESALEFVPSARIEAIHDSITSSDYGINFFKKFKVVFNALDNRAARSHVNRMCLAADVPLVESGTAGYFGQVTVINKKMTECYDCQPKPHQKSFPGCTIRNTPSEPIHCIVWAKHLFNQLFGEVDPDEDVSPDSKDPESTEGGDELQMDMREDGNVTRISTRQWAIDNNYEPKLIFDKLFNQDILYLLSMDKLWAKRRPPVPLDLNQLPGPSSDTVDSGLIRDQQMWSLSHCARAFSESLTKLGNKFKASEYKNYLVWDKDDEESMDFVAACANIRAHIFGISQKTRFDIKSMAGNIIPAIATTNAIIAGCIVMEGLKILSGKINSCKTVYLRKKKNVRNRILVPSQLNEPNPKCYVCSEKREVSVKLHMEKMTVKLFEDKVLKASLGMIAPDVEVDDGKGTILVSSDPEDDTQQNADKSLKEMGLKDGSILTCDDFLQEYNLKVYLYDTDSILEPHEFEIVGALDKPADEASAPSSVSASTNDQVQVTPHKEEQKGVQDDQSAAVNDDIIELDMDEDTNERSETKSNRKRVWPSIEQEPICETVVNDSDDDIQEIPVVPVTKKARVIEAPPEVDDDVICIE